MTKVERRKQWVLFLVMIGLLAGTAAFSAGSQPDDEKKLPLEPTRKVELTVHQGTWLSLDVTPDGTTIVFELLGDLYTLPIEGGEAVPLTTGMAFDSQPRTSPDGRWIAFVSDRDGAENLWILPVEAGEDGAGEPVQLTRDTETAYASPAWTADSTYVVVSRASKGSRTFELWMYHIHGGTGVQVTQAKVGQEPTAPRHNALGVTASPDGRYLYYARRTGGFMYNATFPLWQIARRDLVTGDEDVLTSAFGSAIRPVLSPDGHLLVYGTRHDAETGLRIRDLRTGEDRWLIWPVQHDEQESRFTRDLLPGYAFAPGGEDLILTAGGGLRRVSVATGEMSEIPMTARISQGLGPRLHFPRRVDDGPVRARLIQGAVASPDGSALAFSSLTRLYVQDLPDGEPRRLTKEGERGFQPAFSPDGRWIAYGTWDGHGGGVWRRPADGSAEAERLSIGRAFYSDPVYSPDGSKIVALRGSAWERISRRGDFAQVAGMDLVWLPAEGGEARLVMPARGVGRPHFGPEDDRVYVGSEEGLLSVRLDGTDRRTHLQVKGPGLYAAEEPVPAEDLRVDPRGRWVLAQLHHQLYLVALPRVGGKAPTVDLGSPALPARRITDVGADDFGWADGGDTIAWSVGSTFFRRALDTVTFDDEEKDGEEDEGGGKKKVKKKKGEQDEEEKEPKPREETLAEAVRVDLEIPRHRPRGTIALSGARLVTMNGDEVIENGVVVVENDRIVAVGSAGEIDIPDHAHRVDVSGDTVVPGFVDTHAHWFEIRRGVLEVNNWSFLANLAYGVTTGLDVQTGTPDMFAYQDLIDTGAFPGPRAFSTGPGIFSNNAFESLAQVEAVVERYKTHYRNHNLKAYLMGDRRQRQWMAQACRKLEMMPTTEGAIDLKLDLTHVLDGFAGNEHAIPSLPLYDDVVELVARSGTGYTPTLLVAYGGPFGENYFFTTEDVHGDRKLRRFVPHNYLDQRSRRVAWFHDDEHVFSRLAAQAAKILHAGGRVGIGSHGQLQGLGYHWEMWALASGGLSPHETLRAATLHGAEIIGVSQDLGSLEPGKLADLVVLRENPLDNIRHTNTVRYVMKNGELFEGDTLDQVWPVEKELEPLWWWGGEPEVAQP